MGVPFEMRTSIPASVLVRELAGEAVLLNLDTGCYFGLSESGARMFEVLPMSESIQSAYEALLAEYEVDAEQLRRDLSELLEKLVEQGLVEIRGE